MKARAPGKLLLSGAYAVLEGAPAIVSAVDRYVTCDSERSAELRTPEVEAAIGHLPAPYFDASELRSEGRKLGLGSSAAILVASLAALSDAGDETSLRRGIEGRALRAHRAAQGGGSGVDVLASIWGGTAIVRRLDPESYERTPVTLPRDLSVEVWAAPSAASTRELLSRVDQLRVRDASAHATLMAELRQAAERAADALREARSAELLRSLEQQRRGLVELGAAARADIVTDAVLELAAAAGPLGAVVLPSGAGGGDIVLWVSPQPSPPDFRRLAARLGHQLIPAALETRGVHRLDAAERTKHGS